MIDQQNINNPEIENKYIIHIDNFDGPLDLLWDLIKKSKIDIAEVSISGITEQYIAYLKHMEGMNIKIALEFIAMASELLYYKSKALLPGGELEDEYFTPPLPPELVQKLLEYKKYQSASELLRKEFDQASNTFTRVNVNDSAIEPDTVIEVSLYDLLKAFAGIMDSTRVIEQEEIIFDEILVSDRIDFITGKLKDNEVILFEDIFEERPTRPLIIASFLAILEMARTRLLKIVQTEVFGNIRLLRNF
jgi:segregation and condensation protein A